ncbi:MAG TPA: hypothetical protein VEC99_01015 [Clostridia bacterium]|nr:hypothetical protein [Clostridia bacterium]
MAQRNAPQKAGRIRGHGVSPANQIARFVVEETHRPPAQKGKSHTPQQTTAAAMTRAKRAGTKFKPPQMGGEGRIPLQSPSTRRENLSNVKRKPAARRGRTRKKALRG